MKSINQLIYSIASIFAIVSACAALPINVASIDHASELMVGLLALTCISVTILACTCCHRNKSGFEEFENENTIVDQTNSSSRSEFPIFRAISPPNACHSLNNAENSLDNRLLSNIVNQNQMNRTFNEFESSQNNNGPISAVDMENIQNNNAVDYIPNRNEINITIEPSPHSINRNLVEVHRGSSSNMNATTSTNMEQTMPSQPSAFENVASCSNFEPLNEYEYHLNEFNAYRSDEIIPHFAATATASESLNNYIDLEDEDDDTEFPREKDDSSDSNVIIAERVCHRVEIPDEAREPISHHKINIVIDSADDDDDAISVEEALRALDFAISGGESVFSDYQDSSSSDECEHNDIDDIQPADVPNDDQQTNDELNKTESKCSGLIKTVDAKDRFSVNEDENNAEIDCDIANSEHSREYVYEIAKTLVDGVLEECTQRISTIYANCPDAGNNEPNTAIETDAHNDGPIPANTSNENCEITDLDDSMEETFIMGKLEASTPCHKMNVNFQHEPNRAGLNLFQTLNEVNESALSDIGVEPLQTTQTIAYTTFEVQPNQLATTFIKNNDDQTFVADNQSECLQKTFDIAINEVKPQNEVPRINPTIKIDKEEVNSDDLTTITPMNTPIELNYVGESWDQFISKSMSKKTIDLVEEVDEMHATIPIASNSKNPWFLHAPQSNNTFDVNDADYSNYDGMDEDSESVEENAELLSLTFDALRKQLADALPQASVRPSVDYSDDEDNATDSDPDCDSLEYNTRFENPKSEVVINYKQQLSPILEESEDETCKTFVMNETKCLDSTSTGCIETSEAIMGVTKVLMASNDTLFNFEDTLGDREDLLSPRNPTNSGSNTVNSTTPQPDNCKTPTNEAYLMAYPADYKPNNLNGYNDMHLITEMRPTSLQLNLENLTNNLGDLLSPEQQKTFSEEINTIEQLSSDLSATIDATNTLDDLKTCISVHLNDDVHNGKLENSENEAIIIDQSQSNSPIINGSIEMTVNTYLPQTSAEFQESHTAHNTINSHDCEKNASVSPSENFKCVKALDLFEPIECAKENKSPNLDFLKNVTKSDIKTNFNKSFELNQLNAKIECQPQSEQNNLDRICESAGQLSGEEDPWASHPINDLHGIQFSGPRTDNVMHHVTETFTTNDWDSDIEDSNSSEEFLYAKGVSQIGEYLRSTQDINYPLKPHKQISIEFDESIDKSPTQNESSQETGDEQMDAQDIWNSHEDLIAVTTNADADSADDVLDESSISENENEWVPSSWDSLAKPIRSALKSPDKSSSKNGTKSRRSVVFKKQSYQSVYEYPKEHAALSPTTQNGRQGWATYLVNSSPFSSSTSDSYLVSQTDEPTDQKPVEFNALDGFAVSSSSRPFHLTQFTTECRTWPTENDFSWSQIQSDKEQTNSDSNHSEGWSRNFDKFGESRPNGEIDEPKSLNSIHRPDSGVGESVELFSESLSFGDLCHTKASLRLPLTVYSATITNEKDTVQATTLADDQNELSKSLSQTDYSENVVASDSMDSIVPTSCTGSMDSINSFDGGKSSQNHLSNSTNADGLLINATDMRMNISNENSVHNDPIKKCDYRTTANRQSDSTDEDSGIENIVRVTKEI